MARLRVTRAKHSRRNWFGNPLPRNWVVSQPEGGHITKRYTYRTHAEALRAANTLAAGRYPTTEGLLGISWA